VMVNQLSCDVRHLTGTASVPPTRHPRPNERSE
jgi:hypothetical protein